MFEKISGIKNVIWALLIVISLLALLVGLISAAIKPYDGNGETPVVSLGAKAEKSEKSEKSGKDSDSDVPVVGELNELPKNKKAGEDYISSLTLLVDSASLPLVSYGANPELVWQGDGGTMPVNLLSSGKILFPGDGSLVSVSNAAMISKPEILVILVGIDGLSVTDQATFKEAYGAMLGSVLSVSPETKIVCCSIPSFSASYAPVDGLTTEMVNNANLWLQEVCRSYAVWYADTASLLCQDGFLRSDYAASDGISLNGAAADVIFDYLRSHALQ